LIARALVVVGVAVALLLAQGCASYVGSARDFSPARLVREPGWVVVHDVPLARQRAEADCGSAAIAMVVAYWTRAATAALAAQLDPVPARGLKARVLREFAVQHGLAAFLVHGELADLDHELAAGRPVVVGLVKPQRKGVLTHYEVVVARHAARGLVVTLDPAEGWRQNTDAGFLAEWQPAGQLTLIVSPPPTP
jgi:ABC-type bacteriocin/lantibiotic exporter with double-glycine peptidase domain